jgi:hypothetical protein
MSTAIDEWRDFAPPPRELGPNDRWHTFLSYRNVNRPWVINLYDVLRSHGHEVFMDRVAIAAGEELRTALEEALMASQAGALIWSREATKSDWVKREYEVMDRRASQSSAFHFVPIQLDGEATTPFVASRLSLDFVDYPDGPNGSQLLRLLHALVGEPYSPEAHRFATDHDEEFIRTYAAVGAAIENGNARRLVALFEDGGLAWQTSAVLGCRVAEGLTGLNRTTDALWILTEVIARFPKAIRPRQLSALAHLRLGTDDGLDEAQMIVGQLYALGETDPETLGIYASTWMKRWVRSDRSYTPYLEKSRDLYRDAFKRRPDDYYTGINAAAKSLLLGETDEAEELAQRVAELVGNEKVITDYWQTATAADAQLILRRYQDAARLYQSAVAAQPLAIASHRSTFDQVEELTTYLNPSDSELRALQRPFEHLRRARENDG